MFGALGLISKYYSAHGRRTLDTLQSDATARRFVSGGMKREIRATPWPTPTIVAGTGVENPLLAVIITVWPSKLVNNTLSGCSLQ